MPGAKGSRLKSHKKNKAVAYDAELGSRAMPSPPHSISSAGMTRKEALALRRSPPLACPKAVRPPCTPPRTPGPPTPTSLTATSPKRAGKASSGQQRQDSSLGRLTQTFHQLMKESDGTLDLNDVVKTLGVQKRRVYDITNVLEGIGVIEKTKKNIIQWAHSSSDEDKVKTDALRAEVAQLDDEEAEIDRQIALLKNEAAAGAAREEHRHIDVHELMADGALYDGGRQIIAIRAPRQTRLDVHDGLSYGKPSASGKRVQIRLATEAPNQIHVNFFHADHLMAESSSEDEDDDMADTMVEEAAGPACGSIEEAASVASGEADDCGDDSGAQSNIASIMAELQATQQDGGREFSLGRGDIGAGRVHDDHDLAVKVEEGAEGNADGLAGITLDEASLEELMMSTQFDESFLS